MILERSNKYPEKGCLCEGKWRQKINRDIFYSAAGTTTWRKRRTAENLSIYFPGSKNRKKGEKKLEKHISPHRFQRWKEKVKDKEQQWEK